MTADEQREVDYRIKLLEMAGEHCGANATHEFVLERANAYLIFSDEGRAIAQDKKDKS